MAIQLFRTILLSVLAITFTHQAWAVAITSIPFEWGTRSAWSEVIEAESGLVTKSGSWSNFYVGGGEPWNQGTWLFSTGSYIETTFSVAADTLVIQFESDKNDGLAEFLVDGISVGILDTYDGGWFGVEISDLPLATHTLRVRAAGSHPGFLFTDDLAIDVLGAKVSAVPEPTTLALMGLGLAGIGYRRHRSKKAA